MQLDSGRYFVHEEGRNTIPIGAKDADVVMCRCCRAISPQRLSNATMRKKEAMREGTLPGRLAPVCQTTNASDESQLSDGDHGDSTKADSKILSNENGTYQNDHDVQGDGKCTSVDRWMKRAVKTSLEYIIALSCVQRGALDKWDFQATKTPADECRSVTTPPAF